MKRIRSHRIAPGYYYVDIDEVRYEVSEVETHMYGLQWIIVSFDQGSNIGDGPHDYFDTKREALEAVMETAGLR